ncbi:MAG: hypothetical protein A2600_01820 [Candidatus Lambdaproteobacteria bacterium RIFOXYD1_FULL_56_27]|uniref:Flagellar assembly protein T N-terminal domain-containing protein n=1 Tax=Candidatus Lambdaproteobacteria bacterium RIFOXYD2_FULL_56_26 TaxID=1817773 RepID=A0A1F6GMV2_9PROT|nr:MAG: hypothetical protein A2557_12610 [Candidatus Lambdaproteobacteria bacterium RIFOXYD2_FULL_56_26]OGH05582.1 MAG: hypothetical protein A2426_04610 [Candidatus Lambdaproteobacteria bacterium RIFOXYC1_FULL_56_13]OGH08541.1 MAG: hypothetical protein A2600_01820 [Candidatus Lambdaproteobacteria bacterium RIFOXYD1_FULL_56_27]
MKLRNLLPLLLLLPLALAGCGGGSPKPTHDSFLTLADLSGRTTLKEDSPDVRVITVKAKAFIKQNDLRSARQQALELASRQAVDEMVRELLTAELYNENFTKIDTYMSKNIDNYVVDQEVMEERKVFMDKFFGVNAAFKVSRQKTLVALQKELKIIDNSMSTLVTVVTSNKDLDLSAFSFKFKDVEEAMMNQMQTDLNQKGLRAMDFRNAVTSFNLDAKRKAEFGNISKEQFMAILQGSKPEEAALNAQVQGAEDFYKTGLTLLKQLSRVVVEVNIMSITKTGDNMAMNVMVTAKNISSPTGGAFANSTLQVARRGSDKTDNAAMLGALIKDAYEQMSQEFLPQVIKEMSIVDAAGGKLVAYDLVLQGFDSNDARSVRNGLKKENADNFRYIDYNNELSQLEPPMNIIYVRWNGKPSGLADKVMESLDGAGLKFSEPIVTPTVRDLVFVKQAKD